MEREIWSLLVRAVRAASRGRRERERKFSDMVIVLTFLWAVLHDRAVSWAVEPRNWPFYLRIKERPSSSTMSRRLRSASVLDLLRRLECRLSTQPDAGRVLIIDAKPLPVGGYTHDRDARSGRGCGCFQKGYKLCLVIDESSGVHAWKVESMNVAEQRVAEELIPRAAISAGRGRYVVGDKAYCSATLYALAAEWGLQLVAPRFQRGDGIGPNNHPHAHAAAAMLEGRGTRLGRALMNKRDCIERFLGTATARGGGLNPLPGHVRGHRRVSRWVQAKLLIEAIRIRLRNRNAA